ncbi:MAG: hypothetical protein KatS3mg105_0271 [Gemmatales bacterium]|nr:MAG: hypothetical protein KatS3mg105_0271 [Gemmatales bacterium]
MKQLHIALLFVVAIGCGDGRKYVPVSGTVTYKGKPLANASVIFQPIAEDNENPGSGSFGRTDEEGRFTLKRIDGQGEGALAGKHRVSISIITGEDPTRSDAGETLPVNQLPPEAASQVFQVPETGTDQANFDF